VLPGVSLYRRPTDATFVLNMVLALLAGFVMDRLAAGRLFETRSWRLRAVLGVTAALLAWGVSRAFNAGKLTADYFVKDVFLALLFIVVAVLLLRAIASSRSSFRRSVLSYAALVLLVADLAAHNTGTRLNAEGPELWPLLHSQTRQEDPARRFLSGPRTAGEEFDRVAFTEAGAAWPNAVMMFGIYGTQGVNPLRYDLYDRVAGAQEDPSIPPRFTPMMPGYTADMFNLLGVRFIASVRVPEEIADEGNIGRFALAADGQIKIWRNPRALPRTLMATKIFLDANVDRTIEAGLSAQIDYMSTVVLDHSPSTLQGAPAIYDRATALSGEGEASASIVAYRNNEVIVWTRSERDAILVLNDVYYPYWRVYVDDEERELLRANYLFRGVHVGPGEHEVTFRFEPFSWPGIQSTFRRLFLEPGGVGIQQDPTSRVP
jgi:hypothetical protein